LKKAKYWRRNGGFSFSPEVKVYLLIDSPMARVQSTETILAGITCADVSLVVPTTKHSCYWFNSIKLEVNIDHVKNINQFEKAKTAKNE